MRVDATSGDAYILLSTKQKGGKALEWSVHFWLGSESSQDERGVAAYKTVELDDALGGGERERRGRTGVDGLGRDADVCLMCVGGVWCGLGDPAPSQYREVQENESALFLSYFKVRATTDQTGLSFVSGVGSLSSAAGSPGADRCGVVICCCL